MKQLQPPAYANPRNVGMPLKAFPDPECNPEIRLVRMTTHLAKSPKKEEAPISIRSAELETSLCAEPASTVASSSLHRDRGFPLPSLDSSSTQSCRELRYFIRRI